MRGPDIHHADRLRPGARAALRRAAGVVVTALGLAITLSALPARAVGGTLDVYETSAGPGGMLVVVPPAVAHPFDLDFDPSSAEGGGVYSLSEVEIATTGDVTIDATGFSCGLIGCLTAPSAFAGGANVMVTGGNNVGGEFSTAADILDLRFSGSLGYVVLVHAEYLDASGAGQTIGAVQSVDLMPLARVPEPAMATGLLLGALAVAGLHPRRQRALDRARRQDRPVHSAR